MRAGRVAAAALVAAALVAIPTVPAAADPVRDAQYWLDEYGIRTAWTVTQGAGVTIAIIDTGVDGTVPELLPLPVARNFVALYFSEALAPGVDPAALIAMKAPGADEEIVVGWTVGPDRRAIFGAMVHDDAAFVMTFDKKFKSKSGKAFNGANNAAQLAEFGITVETAP